MNFMKKLLVNYALKKSKKSSDVGSLIDPENLASVAGGAASGH